MLTNKYTIFIYSNFYFLLTQIVHWNRCYLNHWWSFFVCYVHFHVVQTTVVTVGVLNSIFVIFFHMILTSLNSYILETKKLKMQSIQNFLFLCFSFLSLNLLFQLNLEFSINPWMLSIYSIYILNFLYWILYSYFIQLSTILFIILPFHFS